MTTRHQLLVSVPDHGDENFDRTVVYMLDHDEDGAMGLVLNRPTSSEVDEHLDELPLPVSSPGVFFMGGPVSVGGLLALGLRQMGSELEHAIVVDGPVVVDHGVVVQRLPLAFSSARFNLRPYPNQPLFRSCSLVQPHWWPSAACAKTSKPNK